MIFPIKLLKATSIIRFDCGLFLVGRKGWQYFSKQADCGLAADTLFALLPIEVMPGLK